MVVSERHMIHHLREKGYVERPVRVAAILKGLEGLPIERVPTRNFSEDHLTAVHTPALVNYLKAMGQRLDPKAIIYPEVFPIRRPDRVPRALEDRAGYFCADTFTPLTQNSFIAAKDAANVALTAATLVANGERFAYALVPAARATTPSGASTAASAPQQFGNRRKLPLAPRQGGPARHRLSPRQRRAGHLLRRDDVLTVSIHGHPSHAYPNFSGYSDERGEGAGLGFNHNFPYRAAVDDERYLGLLDARSAWCATFKPRFSSCRSASTSCAATRPAHSPSPTRACSASASDRPLRPADAHRAGGRLLARQPALRLARLLQRHHRRLARLSRSAGGAVSGVSGAGGLPPAPCRKVIVT